ncbi:MAG: ATP-binding protein [Akkermansiaceae bacterium]|nr:ATP-binding protein [Akkermansiaceae bacterium]
MIQRSVQHEVEQALARQAAVALIGPRQVGKTTLAHAVAAGRPSVYLDLENPTDRAKLAEPELFLGRHEDRLVILDEIHRVPELFSALRGIIDKGRREGRRTGRFLMLGSAAIELMRQSETLAGRIAYVDMGPLSMLETGPETRDTLWLRGGFPDSYLAADDAESLALRRDFIRTYLERDVPMFGPRIPAETLERLWTMLAHCQGSLLNASKLASGIGVSAPTVGSYLGLLVDLLLLRRLPPFHRNVGKRLVKSPKTYVRDSGLLHALLGIGDFDSLLGHPVIGASWEGFVIDNLIAAAPAGTKAGFYRTAAGAEIDLVLELGAKHGVWAVEIKRSATPGLQKGNHHALADIAPRRSFYVHGGTDRFPMTAHTEAISLHELAAELAELG